MEKSEEDDMEVKEGEDELGIEEKEEVEQVEAVAAHAPRRSPRLRSIRTDTGTVQSHPQELLQTGSER